MVSGDDPLKQNIVKLQKNRIEMFVDEASVVKNHLLVNDKKAVLKELGCLKPVETYIAFSPAHPKAK